MRRSLDLTSWEAASELVRGWEAAGEIGVVNPEVPTIKEAVDKFLHDLEHGQKRVAATLSKHRNLLEKRLLPYCTKHGYRLLKQLTADTLTQFRATWPDSAITAQKNLERLRSFCGFCVTRTWMKTNPASALKAPSIGKASDRVKVFTDAQIEKIISACDRYPERNAYGHDNPTRVRAFVMTLRYSGLRIGDCVGLRREHFDGARLFLRTAKTGEPVYVPLPAVAVDALNDLIKVSDSDADYFFWTGNGLRKSAVADWQRSLRWVFKEAKVKGNPHMFRHTAATDLLSNGVPIEDVAILLGHATPSVTSKYYAHFVKARRERLEERIKAVWA